MTARAAIAAAAALIGAAAPGRAVEPVYDAPLRSHAGHYLMTAHVNGAGPFDLLLDTGATSSGLALPILHALGAAPEPQLTTVHSLTGSGEYELYRLDQLVLGDIEVHDISVVGMPVDSPDEHWVDGVVGLDVLDSHAIELDPSAGTLRVFRGAYPTPRGGRPTRVKFALSPTGLPFIGVHVGGAPAVALIDTGLNASVINSPLARRLPKERGARIVISPSHSSSLVGMSARREETHEPVSARLQIGSLRWRKQSFAHYDAPVFERLGLADKPAILLGADALDNHVFVMDFARDGLMVVRGGRRAQ
ncbi:MAG: aspartyl protease family protein [Caulobacterales bacterium]|nr:aspartyl protease family protein [Caulobacterales bacterium]